MEENRTAVNLTLGLGVIVATGIAAIGTGGLAVQSFISSLFSALVSGGIHAAANKHAGQDAFEGFAQAFAFGAITGAVSPLTGSGLKVLAKAKPILENTLVAMGVEGLIETGVESTVIGMQGGPVTPLTFLGDWVINSFTSGANPQMQKLTQWFDGLLKKIGNFVANGWNKLTKFVDNFLEDTAGFFDDLGVNYDEVADAVIDNSSAKLNSNSDLNTYVDNLGGQPTKDLDTLMQELGIPRSLTDDELLAAKQLELQMNANKSQADEVLEEVIEGGSKTIPYTDYDNIYQSSIHNADADMVMLGKYDGGGPSSYIKQAGDDYTYFSFDNWNDIKKQYGFTDEDMFKLFNEPFLDDGINAGKTFKFSHDPTLDTGSLGAEFEYLIKNNYIWDPDTMTMSPKY